jgi:hypothetical protein
MLVYLVLGTAPLGVDRLSLLEVGHDAAMLSFCDYGSAFDTLSSLIAQLERKQDDHLSQTRSAP